MEIEAFRIKAIPNQPINLEAFLNILGKDRFMLIYDTKTKYTYFYTEQQTIRKNIKNLENVIIGLSFKKSPSILRFDGSSVVYTPYTRTEHLEEYIFFDIFDVLNDVGLVCILFLPQNENKITAVRQEVEKLLTGFEVRKSSVIQKSKTTNVSLQYDIFQDSDDSIVLTDILESINASITKNGIAYKTLILAPDNSDIYDYIKSRIIILDSKPMNLDNIKNMLEHLDKIKAFSTGPNISKRFFGIYGNDRVEYIIPTIYPKTNGDIHIGNYVKNASKITSDKVMIESDIFNLGCIIGGMPGSGKTREAMAIIDHLLSNQNHRPHVVILASTDEWDTFANDHGMYLIKVQKDKIPINFFRCPAGADISKFYSDLSLILSAAATAGPYRDPIEKCLLNAFRRAYKHTKTPNPSIVFDEINESIIKLHAKRTNTGVRYTKHGENIKSSLEGLLEILTKREYSETDGIQIEDMIRDGVVFNISNSGVNTQSYIYSLLLTQIYTVSSQFDNEGYDKLRMLICVEEAQTIFKDSKSPTIEDIKHRIQDFRKKGIGLMLLTHNAMDIDPSIRRLCQIKLYFKQAPDIAPIIAKDLIFTYSEEDEIAKKIRHLDSRIAALNYVSNSYEKESRITHDTIFIMTKQYNHLFKGSNDKISCYASANNLSISKNMLVSLNFSYSENIQKLPERISRIRSIRINYLNEPIIEKDIASNPTDVSLMQHRIYTLEILDDKSKTIKSLKFIPKKNIQIKLP